MDQTSGLSTTILTFSAACSERDGKRSVKEEHKKKCELTSHLEGCMHMCSQATDGRHLERARKGKVMQDQISTATPNLAPHVQEHIARPAEALGAEQSIGAHRSPVYK